MGIQAARNGDRERERERVGASEIRTFWALDVMEITDLNFHGKLYSKDRSLLFTCNKFANGNWNMYRLYCFEGEIGIRRCIVVKFNCSVYRLLVKLKTNL